MAGFAIKRTLGEGWTFITAEPKSSFKEYGQEVFAGDGSRVELGYVDIEWDYGNRPLSGEEMYQFLTFCSGATANVYVRTKTREVDESGNPVFRAYRAVMYRPDGEFLQRTDGQWFINVKVRFRGSVEVAT